MKTPKIDSPNQYLSLGIFLSQSHFFKAHKPVIHFLPEVFDEISVQPKLQTSQTSQLQSCSILVSAPSDTNSFRFRDPG